MALASKGRFRDRSDHDADRSGRGHEGPTRENQRETARRCGDGRYVRKRWKGRTAAPVRAIFGDSPKPPQRRGESCGAGPVQRHGLCGRGWSFGDHRDARTASDSLWTSGAGESPCVQCAHELAGLDHGNARRRHAATSMRLTPMISAWRGISAPRAFRSARQSAITSRMFLMASSYVRPCV